MPFFARPDLSSEQFKQLAGSTLTLSGQTQIATPSGFTLSDGNGGNIPLIATGGTNNKVLTYINGKIVFASAGGSDGIYGEASPTTYTVGGLQSGTPIFGCTISCILKQILVPTLYPTFVSPSATFSISPSTLIYEVGSNINVVGTSTFNRGSISPAYGTSGYRSGTANCYEYNAWGSTIRISSTQSSNTYSFPTRVILEGNNTISSKVCYNAGEQPKDGSGNNYSSPLSAGATDFNTISICGMYPYFYGKYASGGAPAGKNRPIADENLMFSGNKIVSNSTGTININFNSTNDDYIWFAVPIENAQKKCWYISALNNGNIGGGVSPGCNLFPNFNNVSVSWYYAWVHNYAFYISNYQTAVSTIMEIRNS